MKVSVPASPAFDDLRDVDTIRITNNLGVSLGTVTDPDRIRAVIDRLCELGPGWYVPEDGVRVLKVRLDFHAGDRTRGNLGIGNAWLTTHQHSEFAQRESTPQLRRELFDLLGMPDPAATG